MAEKRNVMMENIEEHFSLYEKYDIALNKGLSLGCFLQLSIFYHGQADTAYYFFCILIEKDA